MTTPVNRSAHPWARRAIRFVAVAAVAVTAAASDCSDSATSNESEGFTMAVTSPAAPTVAPGGSVAITITIQRVNGFTGGVEISTSISGNSDFAVAPVVTQIAADATTGTVTITAPTTEPAGQRTIVFQGSPTTAPAGTISGETLSVPLNVVLAGTFTLGLAANQNIAIVQGQTTHIPVTIVRSQYTQAVTLAIPTTLPSELTVAYTQPGTGSTGDIAITASSTAALTVHQISVTASGTGAPTQTVPVQLSVQGPFVTLALNPSTITVAQGNSTTPVTITATRAVGNTGDITITGGASLPGVTLAPATIVNTQVVGQVSVASSVPVGTYQFQVLASQSQPPNTTSAILTVKVVAATSNTVYTFCPATGLPVWVAVQDGSNAWTAVSGASGVFPFNITATFGGIAYAAIVGGVTNLHIFYGTQAELAAQGASLCSNSGATSTVNGSVTNTGTAAEVIVGLGSAASFLTPPSSTTFQFTNLEPGPLDLVASTLTGSTPKAPIKMLLRRNVNPATTLGSVDFSTSEAFTPARSTLTVNNALGGFVQVRYLLHTANNPQTLYYSDGTSASTFAFFGLPVTLMQAGDLHYISAFTTNPSGPTTSLQTAGVMFGAVASQAVTFGPVLNTPTVTSLPGTTYARLQAVMGVQASYGKLFEADFEQSIGSDHNAFIQMTGAYASTASTVTLNIPDFTSVAGWSNSYGPVKNFLTQWLVTGSTWSASGGITMSPYAAGNTVTSATAEGTITP